MTSIEIAKANDLFRSTFFTSPRHKIITTSGIAHLREHDEPTYHLLLDAVRSFRNFNPDNDPHGEHDFGDIVLFGLKYFWKIDYYDMDFEYGKNPYEQPVARLLTIMLTDEY